MRAHLIPLIPGGPLDLAMIWRVYRGTRLRYPAMSRRIALAGAARNAREAWRFLRAEQRTGVEP